MNKITVEQLDRHIRSHTERSSDDSDAVSTLRDFLKSGGEDQPRLFLRRKMAEYRRNV